MAGDLGTAAPAYLAEVSDAFMSGFGTASLVVAFVAAAGALFAAKFLPARATDTNTGDDIGEVNQSVLAAHVAGELEQIETHNQETTHA